MSHIIRINDDQLDNIVRSELEFQRDCCDQSEDQELIDAFNKVLAVFTPASEIINREQRARSELVDKMVACEDVRVSYHFGV